MTRRTRKKKPRFVDCDLSVELDPGVTSSTLRRTTGVVVSEAYHNAGVDRTIVDIQMTRPELTDGGVVAFVPVDPESARKEKILELLDKAHDRCAAVRDEMTRTMERLANYRLEVSSWEP